MDKNDPEQIEYCNILASTQRTVYDTIRSVYCPILRVDVVFNARGFHHLLYDSSGTARNVCERIYKLTLMPLVIPVIKNALSVKDERDVSVRISRKKNSLKKDGKTYALSSIVGRKNPVAMRVIILRIGTGNYMFRSVMKD